MSAQPWFAWYPADFRSKTAHLSFTECEAYRRLIDNYMLNGKPLLANHAALCRLISAIKPSERAATKRVAQEFFKIINGNLDHTRCNDELKKQAEFKARQSAKGKAGADSRWHSTGIAGGMAQAMPRALPEVWPDDSLPQSLVHIPEYDVPYTSDDQNLDEINSYLAQQNSDPPKPNGGWWKTNIGIDAKASELGLTAKPGETYPDLKNRLFEEINRRKAASST